MRVAAYVFIRQNNENPGRMAGVSVAKREGKISHAKGHTNFRG